MEEYKLKFKTYYDSHHREKPPALRKSIMLSSRLAQDRLGIGENAGRLLDVGCGTGELLKLCNSSNISSFGLDISIEGLLMAKQYNVKNLALGDQEFLPFRDNSFEYMTFISTLEYSLNEEHIEKALDEARRVSKKNAKIYIEVRNGDFIVFKLLRIFSLAKLFISETPEFTQKKNPSQAKRYKDLPYSQWNAVFKKSGFLVTKVWKSYKPLSGGSFMYFIKTLFVNMLNLVMPKGLCYRICYLCERKD